MALDTFYTAPGFNIIGDSGATVTRKENYAQTILAHSSLVSYWRLGDYGGISQYSANILKENPLYYWRLNEPSGTSAADRVAGNVGTLHGGITLGASSPIADISTSMTFNGTTGYISSSNKPPVVRTISFEAWVNHGGVAWSGTHEMVVASNNSALYMSVSNGNVAISVNPNAGQVVLQIGLVPTTNWHHIVATWDGSTIRNYVDGVLQGTLTTSVGPLASSNLAFNIGTFDQSTLWFNGSIGEVVVYPYALTPIQIMNHYATGVGKYGMTVLADNPLAYWRLDDASGVTKFADYKGSYNATINGSPTLGAAGATTETDTATTFTLPTDFGEVLGSQSGSFDLDTFSIECWWKTADTTNYKILFAKGGDSAGSWGVTEWGFVASPGNGIQGVVGSTTDANSADLISFGSNLSINVWHHLVMSVSPTTIYSYVDGVAQSTLTRTKRVTPTAKNVRTGDNTGSYGPRGLLDEVAYYGYTLSAQQVANHYAASLGKWADSKTTTHLSPNATYIAGVKGALPGDPDRAFSPNGTGYLSVGHNANLTPANITIELWAKPGAEVTSNTLIGKSSTVNWTDGYAMYYRSTGPTGISFWVTNYNSGGSYVYTNGFPLDGKWHHIVGTYDGTNIKIYLDGVFHNLAPYAGPISYIGTPNFNVGSDPGGFSWKGAVDEVAIYNVALTANQILQHYEVGSAYVSRLLDVY